MFKLNDDNCSAKSIPPAEVSFIQVAAQEKNKYLKIKYSR